MKVIVVDDDERVLRALSRVLRGRAMVFGATSADAALEVMAREPIDALITDLEMPGRSGVELLTHLREHHPDVRRYLTSGSHPDDLEVHAASGLVHGCLPKPFDHRALLDLLEEETMELPAEEAKRRALSEEETIELGDDER